MHSLTRLPWILISRNISSAKGTLTFSGCAICTRTPCILVQAAPIAAAVSWSLTLGCIRTLAASHLLHFLYHLPLPLTGIDQNISTTFFGQAESFIPCVDSNDL